MVRKRPSPQRVYWDVVNALRAQEDLTLSQARQAYRDLRDLVGAPLDLGALAELQEDVVEAVEAVRPRVRMERAERYTLDSRFEDDEWLDPGDDYEMTGTYDPNETA